MFTANDARTLRVQSRQSEGIWWDSHVVPLIKKEAANGGYTVYIPFAEIPTTLIWEEIVKIARSRGFRADQHSLGLHVNWA